MPSSPSSAWKTSRPRFWIYLAGPYLLGWTANADPRRLTAIAVLWFALGLAYFLFPANLFLYGVNDLADEETDRRNEKKQGYETRVDDASRPRLRQNVGRAVAAGGVLLAMATASHPPVASFLVLLGFAGFLLLGWQYSAPPVRAKARPYLDSAFNVLYLFPALVGYGLGNAGRPWPAAMPFVAGALWCVAMHAFSAVPDIASDRAAGLETIATRLGPGMTILLCALLYVAAAIFAFPFLGWVSFVGAVAYAERMAKAWHVSRSPERLLAVYATFPWINLAVGALVWMSVAARAWDGLL